MFIINVVLIVEFMFIVIIFIAGIVSTKDSLIIFKNIIIVLIVELMPARVLFVNIKTN